MQIVILAGGVAKRLGELTLESPKGMLNVEGKPFLQYQIELLKLQGVTNIVFCIAHLGHFIEDFFKDGRDFGVRITYSREPDRLLGTGGCVKYAEALLLDTFMVMYGDTYLRLNYSNVWAAQGKHPEDGLMVVYRNENKYDRSNLRVENGFVTDYSYQHSGEFVYIDHGLSVLRKDSLKDFRRGENFGLQEVFLKLIKAGKLRAYEAEERFYEVGSFEGLENFKAYVKKEIL